MVIFLFRRNTLRRLISVLANNYDRKTKQLNGIHKSHVHSKEEVSLSVCNQSVHFLNQLFRLWISYSVMERPSYCIIRDMTKPKLSDSYSVLNGSKPNRQWYISSWQIISVPFIWAGWDPGKIQARPGRIDSDSKHQKCPTRHENLPGSLQQHTPHGPLLRGRDPRQKCRHHKQINVPSSLWWL
jgi:hypothetical protein